GTSSPSIRLATMAGPRATCTPRRVACKSCAMRNLCRPSGADENMVQFTRSVRRGERLCRAGARQTAIYALRSGSLMSCLPGGSGRRFVLRFVLPGDAVGMDALATGEHPTEAIAIEGSKVCVIPVRRAQMLAEFLPAYAAELTRLI